MFKIWQELKTKREKWQVFSKKIFYHSLNIFQRDKLVTYRKFYDFIKNAKFFLVNFVIFCI